MSNCVDIINNRLVFSREEMDIDAFVRRCRMIEGCAGRNGNNLHLESIELFWWWFLSSNYRVNGNALTILLGQGRSGHTHRDLRGVMSELGQYVYKPIKRKLVMLDEYDGFRASFTDTFEIQPQPKE